MRRYCNPNSYQGNLISSFFFKHDGFINSVAFSPDGQVIATGSTTGIVCTWDLQGNSIGQSFLGHEGSVNSVAFSSDGQLIVSGGDDNTVRLWDLQGNPIGQPFLGHDGSVNSVVFSPDGKFIISGSEDKTIRLWRGHWTEWLKVCCSRLKHHPAFTNPQTEDEKRAYDIANRYVFNPHIGAEQLYRKAKQKLTTKDYTAAADIFTLAIQINPDHIQFNL